MDSPCASPGSLLRADFLIYDLDTRTSVLFVPDVTHGFWARVEIILHHTMSCQSPSINVASESPDQSGMAVQMNFNSASDTLRY